VVRLGSGLYTGFFHQGGSMVYMPKNVPHIQRIINNDILKIVNIVFSGGGEVAPPPPPPLCMALVRVIKTCCWDWLFKAGLVL
jgi:hypothetical protein